MAVTTRTLRILLLSEAFLSQAPRRRRSGPPRSRFVARPARCLDACGVASIALGFGSEGRPHMTLSPVRRNPSCRTTIFEKPCDADKTLEQYKKPDEPDRDAQGDSL